MVYEDFMTLLNHQAGIKGTFKQGLRYYLTEL